jgi:hypothetical protein
VIACHHAIVHATMNVGRKASSQVSMLARMKANKKSEN